MKPHRGVMILVFGILSIVFCPLFGIAAWLMGGADLQEIRAGQMDPQGEQMTNVGRILGMVGIGLFLAGLVLFCLLFAVGGGLAIFQVK